MNQSAQLMAEKALALVGQGYLYGAKGQVCSPSFRQQQAQQYPEQAHNILNVGAKWDGMPVWDCAQLTRAAAKAAGISLVSGATSQWTKTNWAQKGTIDSLPMEEAVLVYRQADGKMQHTGVYLGDSTVVHARGTAYGVVRQNLTEHAWTHWASLWKLDNSLSVPAPAVIAKARVWAQSGSTVNARAEPGGKVIARVAIGTEVDVCAQSAGWTAIMLNGEVVYMQSTFLRNASLDEQLQTLLKKLNEMESRMMKAGL